MQRKLISPAVLAQILSEPFQKRFWSKVNKKGPDECWLWTASTDESGRGQLAFRIKGHHHHFKSHRIAWIIHNGRNVPNGLYVLHSCIGVYRCCNPKHLRPGTQLENMKDMDNQGRRTDRKGENSPNAKLDEAQVKKIRALYPSGDFTHHELAAMFNVGHTRIWEIVTNKAWTHI